MRKDAMRNLVLGLTALVAAGCDKPKAAESEFAELALSSPATEYESADPALAVEIGRAHV